MDTQPMDSRDVSTVDSQDWLAKLNAARNVKQEKLAMLRVVKPPCEGGAMELIAAALRVTV